MKEQLNEGQRRRRKMLIGLPIVVLFPLTFLFWLGSRWVGGGKAAAALGSVQGVNMSLPDVKEKAKGLPEDKMGYYDRAAADSARMAERRKQDPYADSLRGEMSGGGRGLDTGFEQRPVGGLRGLGRSAADEQAERVLRQVAEMRRALGGSGGFAGPVRSVGVEIPPGFPAYGDYPQGLRSPVLPVAGYRGNAVEQKDQQLEQLNGMLDKLIRVQHPELVAGRDSTGLREPGMLVTLARDEGGEESGFMEIGGAERDSLLDQEAAIPALVAADQTLTTGSTVELRLGRGVVISGHTVARDQPVFGLATLRGERLEVTVRSLRAGAAILPVDLQVYDLDGLLGIRVPGAITRDVVKESAGEAVNGITIGSVDPSLGAQATSAGVQLARALASQKVKLVRVAVPAGYQVLLKNVKR
jgi:hypothetical protein